MRIVILENADQVATAAADVIASTVQRHPEAVLGLATGGTPLGTYQKLVERAKRGEVAFDRVTTFNLDEYVGLPADHPQSYCTFMRRHLFEPGGFALERCYLPNGSVTTWQDLEEECRRYETLIQRAGGIDLQLLGIGADGHIAFNEPGSSLASRTRVKALTEQTRRDNARFFSCIDEVPRLAITMGIGTILEARRILLLATGEQKAEAVRAFVEGPVSAQVPASALQLHAATVVMLDAPAATLLARKEYYLSMERIQQRLEAGLPL